jgi:hypothetical protein
VPTATIDLTSYSGLIGTVAAYLNRQDLTAQIPAFIAQAEAKFNRELRVRDMQQRSQASASDEYISLPSDFLAVYTLELADNTTRWGEPLRFMTEEEARIWRAENPGSNPGNTVGFTLYGSEIELIDPPTTDIDFRLKYYAKIPSLSSALTSNWLLVKSPDLYVVGACLEASMYLKNDERLATWNAVRTQIMDAMHLESERALKPQNKLNAVRRTFG